MGVKIKKMNPGIKVLKANYLYLRSKYDIENDKELPIHIYLEDKYGKNIKYEEIDETNELAIYFRIHKVVRIVEKIRGKYYIIVTLNENVVNRFIEALKRLERDNRRMDPKVYDAFNFIHKRNKKYEMPYEYWVEDFIRTDYKQKLYSNYARNKLKGE